jgi:hypothetical protein
MPAGVLALTLGVTIVAECVEGGAETRDRAKLGERLRRCDDAHGRHVRPRAQLFGQHCRADRRSFLLHVHRDVEGLIPVRSGGRGILQKHAQEQRQCQGDADHGHGQRGRERLASHSAE